MKDKWLLIATMALGLALLVDGLRGLEIQNFPKAETEQSHLRLS